MKKEKKLPERPGMPEPWMHLREACLLKGIAYNSIARPRDAWKQPNGGKEDGTISGRKAWRPETVRAWIMMDDDAMKKLRAKRIRESAAEAVRKASEKK